MRILAFTDLRYVRATRQVVGGEARVMTSPPTFARDVQPEWFAGYDFVYLDLHGLVGSVYLYSGPEAERAALSLETVKAMSLGGAVVIATTCYLPQTRFPAAFLAAGASAVIAGNGANYGGLTRLSGAQVLARLVLARLARPSRLQAAHTTVDEAMADAKRVLNGNLRLKLFDARATNDALEFQIIRG